MLAGKARTTVLLFTMALLTGIDSFSFCPSSLLGASNRLGKSHCPRTFSRNPVLRESKSSKGKILITPADLSQAFEQMDADGSGSLSAEEVMSVLKAMGYAEQERRCIFENIDADKDGAVSKVEFLRACESETICAIVDEDSKDGGWKEELKEQDATPEDELSVKNFYKSLIQYMRKRPEEVEGKTARRAGRVGDGKVKELKSAEEFEKVMEEAGDFPVVVKFFASWCRKCLALKAKYSGIAKGYGERAIFVKIDIETKGASDLVKKRAGVVAIPTFQVWKGGQPIDKYVAGSVIAQIPGDLAKMIDKHIDGDFSLVKAIEQEPVVEEPPKQEKEQIQLGKAEVNQDAMAAWRAAQAAKTSFSRNPFKN